MTTTDTTPDVINEAIAIAEGWKRSSDEGWKSPDRQWFQWVPDYYNDANEGFRAFKAIFVTSKYYQKGTLKMSYHGVGVGVDVCWSVTIYFMEERYHGDSDTESAALARAIYAAITKENQ